MRVFRGGAMAKVVTEPALEPITIWNLLTHTSGLTYGFHHAHPVDALYRERGFEWGSPPGLDLAACCAEWAQLPLLFQPGTEWNYGVSTDVLGRVVEVISGQPLDEFLAARVLGPLGMVETGFSAAGGRPRPARRALHPPPGDRPRHAQPDVGRGHAPARVPLRRRRARVQRRGLPALHAHAARRRGDRRRAPAQPAHAADDGEQPAARPRRPRGSSGARCSPRRRSTASASGSASRSSRTRSPAASRAHAASSRGAARRAPRSGSTRRSG